MNTSQTILIPHGINSRYGHRRRMTTNFMMVVLSTLLTLIALIPLFWIIGYVIVKGIQYINLGFFTQFPKPLGVAGGGVLHAIEGTLLLTVLAAIFSIPIGLLTAFYAAYNPNTALGVAVRFGTDVLAGVPSIIIGIFCYALIVKPQGHYSALAGGAALAILMLPTIIRTTEEMIRLVPQSMREASLALGAPDWKTTLKVMMPAALTGIITGFLLALARAIGETAPLLFTALGNDRFNISRIVQSGTQNGQSIFVIIYNILEQPVDSLPLTLYKYTQQPFPERVAQSWAIALVLMSFVLLLNLLVRVYVNYRANQK
jgi:phosphate transport system permease protein